jgi:hypothetical protein
MVFIEMDHDQPKTSFMHGSSFNDEMRGISTGRNEKQSDIQNDNNRVAIYYMC